MSKQSIIEKIAASITDTLCEGFDFNDIDDNESTEDGDIITLSDNALSSFDVYSIRENNAKINIKDLFLGLYKNCQIIRGIQTIGTISDEVGPVWYSKLSYDIKSLKVTKDPRFSYRDESGYMKLDSYRDIAHTLVNELNWDYYASYETDIRDKKRSTEIDPIIKIQLNALCAAIGTKTTDNDWNGNTKIKKNVEYFFCVSPDNGIVFVLYIADKKNVRNQGTSYNWNDVNTSLPCIFNIIFFTGLTGYKLNKQDLDTIKGAKWKEQVDTNFTNVVLLTVNVKSYQWRDENTVGTCILDENDHYIIPGGSTKYITGDWYYNMPKISISPSADTTFPRRWTNKKTARDLPIHKLWASCMYRDTWSVIFANKNLIALKNPKNRHLTMFITPNINVIEKLCGSKVANIVLKLGIYFQGDGSDGKDFRVFAIMWMDENLSNIYDPLYNKEMTFTKLKHLAKTGALGNLMD